MGHPGPRGAKGSPGGQGHPGPKGHPGVAGHTGEVVSMQGVHLTNDEQLFFKSPHRETSDFLGQRVHLETLEVE